MLKMISCNKFKNNAKVITFHNGLNIVKGDGEKSNSIGKSTLLMIIDFCFGGRDYPKVENKTISFVGDHNIDFVFEFNGISYFFRRSTNNSNIIYEFTDETYTNEKIRYQLDDYNAFLADKYNISSLNLTLRSVIGKFFRIYNRHTINEVRPLNSSLNDDDQQAIINFLKLFNCDHDIQSLLNKEDILKKDKTTYDRLSKINAGVIAQSKAEYENNSTEIAKIENELQSFHKNNDTGTVDMQAILMKEKRELKLQYSNLKKQETKLMNSLNIINADDLDETSTTKTIEKLKEFFPEVKIDEFIKIEEFHKGVKSILKSQAKEENNKIESQLALIRNEMKRIWTEVCKYDSVPNVKQEIIDRSTWLSKRLDELKKSNENYEKFLQTKDELKEIKDTIKSQTEDDILRVSHEINTKMAYLEETYGSKVKYPPQIQILSLNSYRFGIPNDTGTANRYKSVVTFDVATMLETILPAVIHDSVFFDAQGDANINYMLKLYRLLPNKQIFIAYDDKNKLSQENQEYIKKNVVVTLSKGDGALFRREFNIKKSEQ